jgi:hypothetical protein
MKCTVVWSKEAEAKLAELWLNGAAKTGITAAANWIDRQLRLNPQLGTSDGAAFVLQRIPLTVRYHHSPPDCLVTITDVELLP